MDIPEIFPSEYKLMQEIWEYGPIKVSDLTRLCERKYGRSKSTTYTNISRPIKRGVLKKQNGIIYAAYSTSLPRLCNKIFRNSEKILAD